MTVREFDGSLNGRAQYGKLRGNQIVPSRIANLNGILESLFPIQLLIVLMMTLGSPKILDRINDVAQRFAGSQFKNLPNAKLEVIHAASVNYGNG